jgi:hypothetical protein
MISRLCDAAFNVHRTRNRADSLNHQFSSTYFKGEFTRALAVCHSIVLAATNRPERHAIVSVSALSISR